MTLNPLTIKKIRRFKAIKRGYWSFVMLSLLLVLSLFAELLINSKALVVKYNGLYSFPVLSDVKSGMDYGQSYSNEPDYQAMSLQFLAEGGGDNYVLMPLVPWDPFEQDFSGDYPPTAPSFEDKHYLGTDVIGRDILARLVYGFRTAMGFALITMVISYAIGTAVGCAMGVLGRKIRLVRAAVD